MTHPRVILASHAGTVEVKRTRGRYVIVPVEDNPRKGILASFGKVEDALRWCASQRRQDGTLIFENSGEAPEQETAAMLGDTILDR